MTLISYKCLMQVRKYYRNKYRPETEFIIGMCTFHLTANHYRFPSIIYQFSWMFI